MEGFLAVFQLSFVRGVCRSCFHAFRASLQVTTATETLSTSWAKKLEIKAKRKAIIAMEKEMKDRKRQEIEVRLGIHLVVCWKQSRG